MRATVAVLTSTLGVLTGAAGAESQEPVSRQMRAHSDRPFYVETVMQSGAEDSECAHPEPDRIRTMIGAELLRADAEVFSVFGWDSLIVDSYILVAEIETVSGQPRGCVAAIRTKVRALVRHLPAEEEKEGTVFAATIWESGNKLLIGSEAYPFFHAKVSRAIREQAQMLGDELVLARAAGGNAEER